MGATSWRRAGEIFLLPWPDAEAPPGQGVLGLRQRPLPAHRLSQLHDGIGTLCVCVGGQMSAPRGPLPIPGALSPFPVLPPH